ncbi:MAG TPA: lysophospholipid acyltransferase family protein [Blastocatellia bacterium]|nr:lysophospholipid acyltransferase family protein [Blastocatellia bacterium]
MLSFIKLIGRPIFRLLFTLEYYGLENVPQTGPVILAGNHPSYLDPLLIGLPIKRVIKFMAWDALFRVPVLGWLIRQLGAFPVDIRKGKGESAFREAIRVLENGYALGIFPEGQRSERGPMGELKTGVARLAIESGAPIVPITIGGASRAWPKWRLLPRPAKIIVRYHSPVTLTEQERVERRDDRDFHRQVMQTVAEKINRSLTPALRGAESLERWYALPPSNIRSYEWAPLAAAIISTFILLSRDKLGARWMSVWILPAAYYLYLAADLTLIKPARLAKWVRNSMPVWLILAWHYPLTLAIEVPQGNLNPLLLVVVLIAFFPFFYEDYYTLQRFVRGLVVVYYFSLALLLKWPHPLGLMIAVFSFIAVFGIWRRTIYYKAAFPVMLILIAVVVFLTSSAGAELIIYAGMGLAGNAYLQTFASVAYDIRKAGDVTIQQPESSKNRYVKP